MASDRLQLGTAVVPVYTRGPGLLAMQAATMAELAPGRFALGVGSSSDVIVERWNATPFTEPYKRVRDTVRFLRQALTGEKVDAEYETFTVRGFRLGRRIESHPASTWPRCGPACCGWRGARPTGPSSTGCRPTTSTTVVPEVGAGKDIVARIFVCPTEDAERARYVGRIAIAAYLNVAVYAAFHEWLGRGPLLEPMWSAWRAGDRKGALAAIPDEVVDDLIVHGSPERVPGPRAALRRQRRDRARPGPVAGGDDLRARRGGAGPVRSLTGAWPTDPLSRWSREPGRRRGRRRGRRGGSGSRWR